MTSDQRKDIYLAIVANLSTLIRDHLIIEAYQQYTPDSDADKSDSITADSVEKVVKLRKLREEFENITTGIISF